MSKLLNRHAGLFQLVFVVAVVGIAITLSTSLKPESSKRFESRPMDAVAVSIVAPQPTAYNPSVRLNGVVAARTVTDVIPQVGGRVIEVSPAFRPGASFRKGDILFRIDPREYELAVDRTLAEIESARSELALLEAQSAAERRVWDQQYAGREIPDLVAKVPQIAAANARIHSGNAARGAAQLSLARTVVRAPFDGRVLDTRLDVGQVVGAGVALGSIFSVDSLEISAPVSGEELALLGDAIGRHASISRGDSSTPLLDAQIVRKSASLDDRTRLRTLFLTADDSSDLTLGEFVGVEIRGDMAAEVYEVPAGSLTSRNQIWVVENDVLRARQVEVIGSDNRYAFVRGFDAADGIVAVPPANSRDGLPVSVETVSRVAGGKRDSIGAR